MNLSIQRWAFSWLAFWLVVAGLSIYLIFHKGIRSGIDLVGGTYIMLQVQTEKAIEAELKNRAHAAASSLEQGSTGVTDSKIANNGITLTYGSIDQAQQAQAVLQKQWRDMSVTAQGNAVHATLTNATSKAIQNDAVERNIGVLRARLDQFSVAEIAIARHGDKDIVIELPDVKDPQQAKAMIGKAAVLEFRIVKGFGRSPEDIVFDMGGELPNNLEILPGSEGKEKFYYAVTKVADVTGAQLRDAQPGANELGRPIVNFEFNAEGAQRFAQVTGSNIGKPLAIVLDNVVISAPNIKSKIPGGRGYIEGNFNIEEVKSFALLLRSGSFVAPVTFEEERQIGPSLGAEAIRQGKMACMVGLALLFIFSIFYYKWAGLLAFLALVFNVILILFGMSQLHATLTLPGIAGIVLTLGMAIDASILIYERIKEELASGLSIVNAVNAGFSDAMMVILDANITTFIVGLVLYRFGTGPIQGFAVTMMLGIISTLLTGLFFLKSLFTFILNNFAIKKLQI